MLGMRCERGQATIEWVGLTLLAAVLLGALVTAPSPGAGRSIGALVSQRIFCAIGGGGCEAGVEADRAPPRPRAHVAVSRGVRRRSPFGVRVSAVGPCSIYSCNPVGAHCTVVYRGQRGREYCRRRAAAEEPSDLTRFLQGRFRACLVGAAGAKAFTPFAEELLHKDAVKSVKNAYRALKRGLIRAKGEVVRGKVKPGLVGCLGGTIGV